MSNYRHVYTPDGKLGDPDGSLRAKANKAYACIAKRADSFNDDDDKKDDLTVREALTACGWEPKTAVDRAVDWALTVDDPGMVPEQQSLKSTLPDQVYKWW
jgi:hypothetical protein